MEFTVKVIFLGMIGFVPNLEKGKDLAALLVHPLSARHSQRAVHEHAQVVYLLKGSCRGQNCQGDGLEWLLDQEKIEISGDNDDDFKTVKPNIILNLLQKIAPGGMWKSSYFSWVPDMEKLTNGNGQISEECRLPGSACPSHSRFLFDGGEVASCHIFHDPEDARAMRIFNYANSAGKNFRRAVADVVQVTFKEEREKVVLSSYRQGSVKEAELFPVESDGELGITLVVASVPWCRSSNEIFSPAHSDALLSLLQNKQGPRPVRILEQRTRDSEPGLCEEDLNDLKDELDSDNCDMGEKHSPERSLRNALISLREAIHAPTACDGIRFPGSM